ncbi:MAG: M28 family peptidase [Armatimonadia bacterium]
MTLSLGLAIFLAGWLLGTMLGQHQSVAASVTAPPVVPDAQNPAAPPPIAAAPTSLPAAMVWDEARVRGHVQYLAGTIGPRPTGSEAEAQAGDYLYDKLTAFGYKVDRQPVRLWNGKSSENLIATKRGDAKLLVIGAHYDSVAASPGANDNASGAAVMLELARLLIREKNTPTIKFVAFGAEEGRYTNGKSVKGTGRTGSRAYVQSLNPAERKSIIAMINMDMVGAGSDTLEIGDLSTKGQPSSRTCLNLATTLGVSCEYDQFGGKSDYAPFHDAGIPIICFAWGEDRACNHKSGDTPAHVDCEKAKAVFDVIMQYVKSLQPAA